MKTVSDIFKVEAKTIQELIGSRMNLGFYMPQFQREYNWGSDQIKRLMDDIKEGILSLSADPNGVTFIGTALTVRCEYQGVDGTCKHVIDGQQRITTLVLLLQTLHYEISVFRVPEFEDNNLKEIVKHAHEIYPEKIFTIIYGAWRGQPVDSTDYYPKIIRAEQDEWNSVYANAVYKSAVADFLKEYLKIAFEKKVCKDGLDTILDKIRESNEKKGFLQSLECIQKEVRSIAEGEPFGLTSEKSEFSPLPDLKKILNDSLSDTLLPDARIDKEYLKTIDQEQLNALEKLIRLISVVSYILNRVTLATINAENEKYAFDMFDALNTAGQPLTALETFKPLVYDEVQTGRKEQWVRTDEYQIFRTLNEYLQDFQNKGSESEAIVIALASLVDAIALPTGLGAQRKFLRTSYVKKCKEHEQKKRFVQNLGLIVNFKNNVWTNKDFYINYIFSQDECVGFCMRLIIEMKTTITIPLLARYFDDSKHDLPTFQDAVKATAAFLALYRAYSRGTSGIDSKFRQIMNDHKSGLKKVNPKLSVNQLRNKYINILRELMDVNETDDIKQQWIEKVTKNNLYATNKPLVKFLILVANRDSIRDENKPHLLKKARKRATENYMRADTWDDYQFQTLEHIAPQERREHSDWDDNIYLDKDTIHTLGNLVLMPDKENSAVSNKDWKIKKKYYHFFSLVDQKELDEALVKGKIGKELSKKRKEVIQNSACVPSLQNISKVDIWDKSIIEERSSNIATLVFNEISSWLWSK